MNEFNISQVSTIVNNILEQMTGQTAQAPITNAADFAAVAQTLLRTGYDPVINAISQVFSTACTWTRPAGVMQSVSCHP